MKHLGTKIIKTDRLILRPFTLEDAPAMFHNWASDPEVTKYLTWSTYTSVNDAHSILNIWVSNYEKEKFYHIQCKCGAMMMQDGMLFTNKNKCIRAWNKRKGVDND